MVTGISAASTGGVLFINHRHDEDSCACAHQQSPGLLQRSTGTAYKRRLAEEVQNAVARVTTEMRKFDHITPVLNLMAVCSQAHRLETGGVGLQVPGWTGASIAGCRLCACHFAGKR